MVPSGLPSALERRCKSCLLSVFYGAGSENIAKGFMDSVEFMGKYGALSDQAFVEQMYLNVVDRAGEKTASPPGSAS